MPIATYIGGLSAAVFQATNGRVLKGGTSYWIRSFIPSMDDRIHDLKLVLENVDTKDRDIVLKSIEDVTETRDTLVEYSVHPHKYLENGGYVGLGNLEIKAHEAAMKVAPLIR